MTLLEFAKQYVRVYCKETRKVLYETPESEFDNPNVHLFIYNLMRNLTDYYYHNDFPTVEAGLVEEEEDLVGAVLTAAYLTFYDTTYQTSPSRIRYVKERTYEISIGNDFKTERYTDIDLR